MKSTHPRIPPVLEQIDEPDALIFDLPIKKIHDGPAVDFFLRSLAYRDIMTFLLQLNHAMVPVRRRKEGDVQQWHLRSDSIKFSETIVKLQHLIATLRRLISQAPPDPGPRRFGNVSFRRWYQLAEDRVPTMLRDMLPLRAHQALPEVEAYLLGTFGSPQRLDYGTGHELSFLAFLGCLWKLQVFVVAESGAEERGIVVGVFEAYLGLVREIIITYNLEPAGSHGVWGLDDNSFLPYIFGSAQLCPAIEEGSAATPVEGSVASSPEPSSVTSAGLVEKERHDNMYFSAVAFIYEIKKGPFWEHSPMLFDISGIKDGWGKINKGMIKMYNAEVLSKFPVVQHFPFGSLFRWERNADAEEPVTSPHRAHQPLRDPTAMSAPPTTRPAAVAQIGGRGTQAP